MHFLCRKYFHIIKVCIFPELFFIFRDEKKLCVFKYVSLV